MPKREPFSMWVPGSPDDVRDQLKQHMEWRLLPEFGRAIRFTRKPLAGWVDDDRVYVSLNQTRWVATMNPAINAWLVPEAGGTRIDGEVGMSTKTVAYLRITFVASLVAMLAGIAIVATAGFGVAAAMTGVFAMVLLAIVGSIGLSVNQADAGIPDLIHGVRGVLLTPEAPPPETHEARDPATRAPQPQRASEGQGSTGR